MFTAKIDDIINVFWQEFSSRNALDILYKISSYHRIQGSKGLIDAGNFIENYVKELGLNVYTLNYSYDGETSFYGYKVPLGWDIYDAELRMVKPKQEILHKFIDSPTMVIAHSPSTHGEYVEGSLLYVGAGYDEDFKGKKIDGKFLLTYGRPYNVFIKAAERGALGIIFFRKDSKVPEAIPYAGLFLTRKEAMEYNKTVALSISENNAKKLISLLERGKKVILKTYVKSEFRINEGKVIIANIKGNEKSNIGFIAHYCHPYPGANDNASGTATLLEMARTLHYALKKKLEKTRFGFSLIWVPEYIGTLALISKNKKFINSLLCVLNLDMVGENQETTGSTFIILRTPIHRPSYVNAVIEYVAKKVFEQTRPFGGLGFVPSIKYGFSSYIAGSDHDIFNVFNIPSIMFNQWPDKFYHTSFDSPDKVSPEILKIAGVAALSTAYIIASPRFTEQLINIMYHWGIKFYHKALGEHVDSEDVFLAIASKYREYVINALASLKYVVPTSQQVLLNKAIRKMSKVTSPLKARGKITKKYAKRKLKLIKKEIINLRAIRDKLGVEFEDFLRFLDEHRNMHSIMFSLIIALWNNDISYGDFMASLIAEYGKINERTLDKLLKFLKKAEYISY